MQRKENPHQEGLVLLLQWKCEAVDDRTEYLQQFRDAIMPLRLVDEMEEDVVDATSDRCTEVEELPVDSVKCRLEEVAFSRILRVEEFEEVEDEGLVNIAFGEVGVEVWALDKTQEEFVHHLEMWPRQLEDWLIFLGIIGVTLRIGGRGYCSEEVRCELWELHA